MKNYQFYHMYPLGMLNKLKGDDNRTLWDLTEFSEHLKSMNINGLYIGPLFESVYHGYDTLDYMMIDRRLGNNEEFKALVKHYHDYEIDVIVDCVFNHVSREHVYFKDVIEFREKSQYKDWFYIDFNNNNWHNDGLSYEDWAGCSDLVKLNLTHPQVKEYLFSVVKFWIEYFDIDGLRLDACDVMDRRFVKELTDYARSLKDEFFVVGEMVHGDYSQMLKETGIESVTNYECYKGMYSSLNDSNYFEIAHSFKRLFGKGGMCENKPLYNFCDNHDVDRVADTLKDEQKLYPLYLMMYTMNGFPSIYYKSEFKEKGKRNNQGDFDLRKPFYKEEIRDDSLVDSIKKFSNIRKRLPHLVDGDYEELVVDHKLIGYIRKGSGSNTIVLINSSDEEAVIDKGIANHWKHQYGLKGEDLLNDQWLEDSHLIIYPNWGRVIV